MAEKQYLILLDIDARKGQCKKINLCLDYEDALILADDDINENWEIYREKFLRGDSP